MGFCVFTAPETEARTILDGDNAVQAKIFVNDVITWYGVPGDGLPAA